MSSLKRTAFGIIGALGLVVAIILAWSSIPLAVDRSESDPAVTYMNNKDLKGAEFSENYFEHDGLNLHYVSAGKGETIVFLHGFPSYWLSFVRQLETFKGDYRVIAIDGLGAGRSDAPHDTEQYRLEAMGEHMVALLDHIGARKVHLVGHDWGSAFAIGLAQRYPERVISVTAMSAPSLNATLYAFENDPAARVTAAYVERFKRANPALLVALGTADDIYEGAYQPLVAAGKLSREEGNLFRKATSNPKRTNAHINWYRANIPAPEDISDGDFWPGREARVTMPALYIWGEDDPIRNETAINRLLELSDDASLVYFPGVGHWPHVIEAERVNAALRRHIAKASGHITPKSSN